ncbi:hypothetical protein MAPG_02015 [Magnaporthiopsis poae ATCC 64411]|uniref:Uncharacterized protein n=1 Tax=Magnaporthiopsis poae (strain ATCC 64411 / 73-15) TaxID=644358 RepID=A0A0C4DQ77_MAGP6|nr:hypothetical protein MAPG_02015 [Magnaporthiopsis poae ATCC 64411]
MADKSRLLGSSPSSSPLPRRLRDLHRRKAWAPPDCTPGTVACARNPKTGSEGWKVCDTQKVWQYAGDCPPKTKCMFLAANGSPYCIPV